MHAPSSPTYARWSPSGPLASWVESFSIQECPRDPSASARATSVLPSGRMDLVIDYADPFVSVDSDGETLCSTVGLAGLRTSAAAYRATGRTGLVLVHFHPWASSFFGPADEFTDRQMDLRALVGDRTIRHCLARWHAAANGRALADLVQAFLTDRIPPEPPDACVIRAVRALENSPERGSGAGSIEALSRSLGMSRRHLQRLFHRHVGASPKQLARILRFQRATRCRRAGSSWSETAARCGYTDQAHLTREFVRIAGVTPGALDGLVGRAPLQSYFNSGSPVGADSTMYL